MDLHYFSLKFCTTYTSGNVRNTIRQRWELQYYNSAVDIEDEYFTELQFDKFIINY